MKKLFFFLAALTLSFTAQAAVINGTPNPGEVGRVNWWVNGEGQAQPGDTIVLADGEYLESTITLDKAGLVIMAAEGAKPVISFNDPWAVAKVSATTTFEGITFNGGDSVNYLVAVSGAESGNLTLSHCEFKNWAYWAVSNQFEEGVSVDSVFIDNCLFHDGAQSAISFSKKAPEGKHACNYFQMTNSTLYNIKSTEYAGIIHVSSNNEDTGMQNKVIIDHVTMYNLDGADLGIVAIRKSSDLTISNTIIANPAAGERASYVYGGNATNVLYYNVEQDGDLAYTNCTTDKDPLFVDAANANFTLAEGSPALGAATDGSNLGDPRWNKPAAATRTVTIVVLPEGAATVTGAGEYEDGASVTVTAEESDEYVFMGWMDSATGEFVAYDYEYTFQVLEDVVLIAYYIPLLEGESNDLVIGENTLTASAELSIGKLNMNLVLGEEEDGMYWLAETSTLSIDGNEAILLDGVAMVVPEAQAAVAEMLVMYNEALYYIGVVMYAPETGVDNITTTVASTKIFKNGQILVVREGVAYDLVGRIVK